MLQGEPKLRKKRKKKWRIALIGFVFIYLFFRSAPSLFAARFKTILPEKKIIEDKIQTEAIIIKKESLYRSDGEGKIELVANEGERVAVGTRIAKLTLLKDTSTLNQELEELDRKIDMLTKTGEDNLSIYGDKTKRYHWRKHINLSKLGKLREKATGGCWQISSNIINCFLKRQVLYPLI